MRRSSPGRYEWMDLVRGLAVFCVVLFHAAAVPRMLGVEVADPILWINNLLLPFRMPALMVLSGILLTRSMGKGFKRYYVGKVANIFWPYAIWFIIFALVADVSLLISGSAWAGGTYLWFLLVVGCCYLIGPVTKWLPPSVVTVAMLALSQLASDPWWVRLGYFGAFFFAGAWFSGSVGSLHLVTRRGVLVASAIGGIWALVSTLGPVYPHNTIYGFVLSFIGVLAIILGASRLRSGLVSRTFQWMGRNSIVLYVAHFPVIVATCQWIGDGQTTPAAVYLLTGLALAMALATLLVRTRNTKWVSWMFAMPGADRIVASSSAEEAAVRRARRTPVAPRELGRTFVRRMFVLDDDEYYGATPVSRTGNGAGSQDDRIAA